MNISLDKLDTIILTLSEYFPLCLLWKSATFNFLLLHFANSCAMSTNINVIKCYEYIYFCKINWNVQLYITNWIRTFEKYSLKRFFSFFGGGYMYYIFSRGSEQNNMSIWLFHVWFISLTEGIYNGFTASIHIFVIQMAIIMNINISIECLFLDIVKNTTLALA